MTSPKETHVKGRIIGFDGLRAIAVGLVVVTHKFPMGARVSPGGYGVHLFFTLSGFLIIGILYGRREALERGTTSFRREITHFYENRLFRIWPPYYLVIFICLLMGMIGIWPRLKLEQLVALTTFTSNIFQGHVWGTYPDHFGALWSVAVEEQFYLWAAAAFLLAPRRYHAAICIAVMLLAIVVGGFTYVSGWYPNSIYFGSITNFGLMALGGLGVTYFRPLRWTALAAPWALALFLACPLIAYAIDRHSGPAQLIAWGSNILVVIVLLGIVADQGSWLVRLLDIAPVRYVGRISYGVYLYHSLIYLSIMDGVVSRRVAGSLEIGLSIAAAALSWHFMEKPLLNLRDRRRLRAEDRKALDAAPGMQAE